MRRMLVLLIPSLVALSACVGEETDEPEVTCLASLPTVEEFRVKVTRGDDVPLDRSVDDPFHGCCYPRTTNQCDGRRFSACWQDASEGRVHQAGAGHCAELWAIYPRSGSPRYAYFRVEEGDVIEIEAHGTYDEDDRDSSGTRLTTDLLMTIDRRAVESGPHRPEPIDERPQQGGNCWSYSQRYVVTREDARNRPFFTFVFRACRGSRIP